MSTQDTKADSLLSRILDHMVAAGKYNHKTAREMRRQIKRFDECFDAPPYASEVTQDSLKRAIGMLLQGG